MQICKHFLILYYPCKSHSDQLKDYSYDRKEESSEKNKNSTNYSMKKQQRNEQHHQRIEHEIRLPNN